MNTREAQDVLNRMYQVRWLSEEYREALRIGIVALDELHELAERWFCIDERSS
jgi:hypothetical protein